MKVLIRHYQLWRSQTLEQQLYVQFLSAWQVRGPMLVVDSTSEGGVHGLRQSAGPVGFGFFIGVRLRDYGAVRTHWLTLLTRPIEHAVVIIFRGDL